MFWLIMSAFYVGLLIGFVGFLASFLLAVFAHVRLTRIERGVRDLDWQVVAELGLDVAKLKKASQKWQNNENAQVKVTQKELLEQALIDRAMQQQRPTTLQAIER